MRKCSTTGIEAANRPNKIAGLRNVIPTLAHNLALVFDLSLILASPILVPGTGRGTA
ncbi:MAG: hypothetical protein WC061_01480 [Melioribacteraceae bacterium]